MTSDKVSHPSEPVVVSSTLLSRLVDSKAAERWGVDVQVDERVILSIRDSMDVLLR